MKSTDITDATYWTNLDDRLWAVFQWVLVAVVAIYWSVTFGVLIRVTVLTQRKEFFLIAVTTLLFLSVSILLVFFLFLWKIFKNDDATSAA